LYRGVVAKVQPPEALFSLGMVPVVIFTTPKSKEGIKASAGWNVGTLEKPEMPLKVDKSCMLTDTLKELKCKVALTLLELLLNMGSNTSH